MGIPHRLSADWSGQILDVARSRDDNGVFVRADAACLPIRNGACDLAMLIDVIADQEQPDHALRELSRVARKLIIRTPLEDCLYERRRRRRNNLHRESSGHVVHFNLDSIRRELARCGWIIRREDIRHTALWQRRRVILGSALLSGHVAALGRLLFRLVVPRSVYRRVFVMNYNALCESRLYREEPAAPAPAETKSSSHKGT